MSQWKNTDSAANSVAWAAAAFKVAANSVNKAAIFANTTSDAFVPGQKVGVFAVDAAEGAAEAAITHAGWVVRREGTGGRAGRVQYETLVAMGSISTDAEDVVLKDVKIRFITNPAAVSVVAPAAATFTVETGSTPVGASVTYQWQANTGAGFTNLTNTGVYSNTAAATLSISNSTGLTGVQYRALALSAGANTITSKAATLTVTV